MERKNLYYHRNLMTGIIVALMTAATMFFCLFMISGINRQMNESATSNLLNTTRVIEGNLNHYIDKDFESLYTVGELYKSGIQMESGMISSLCKTMGFEWVGVTEASNEKNGTFQIKDKPWKEQWKPGERGYSDAYYGDSGRLQTTLWVPIYEDNIWVGTVFGDVLLTKYYSASVFTFYEGKGRTYLFDASDGRWILKSLGTDGLTKNLDDMYSLLIASGNKAEEVEAFRQAVEAKQAGTVAFRFNEEASYICFMPLYSSSDWYVATVIAREDLLKESTQVQRMIQVVLLVFCCALFIFAMALIKWQNRKMKLKEANYREALFGNIFSNIDSVFLIYEKGKKEAVFVSDNIKRVLNLERDWIKEDAGRLFDWCGISSEDLLRKTFLAGKLYRPERLEVCMENEMGMKSRCIRLELIPADMEQEIVVLTDITKDKEIQKSLVEAMQRAESASRAKNDFLSAMSHDIRTPMNGVVGMTAIAAAHLDDKRRVKDCLNKINDASAHLLNLINEILDMSRIESGKMELSEEPFNLAQLLQDVLNMNLAGIKQKNHTVNVHIRSLKHEQVISDPIRMQRIVANILSNAVKYTPADGNISITLLEKPSQIKGYGCYELTVKDDGIGMSAEFQKRLFQPFEREDDERLRNIQGTGLGMSIIKNIVSLMMGNIEVESEKDKGTSFRVTVNLKVDEYEEVMNKSLDKLPVLVVDDDIVTCETVTDMLSDIGMTGEWTDNGETAVEMVADRHFKGENYLAVLVDWKMPGIDGLETARRIRAEVDADIPVIILTAYDWSEIEEEAIEAGVDTFLTKPLYKTKLAQKMLTLVDRPEEMQALAKEMGSRDILAGKRVLLAEDNPLNQEIAVEILNMQGLETVTVENGKEAVKYFADSEPGYYDLILMDIQMPKLNGYDASRAIRAMEREDGKTIPIVAMTADAYVKDIQAAYASGMNEHISKPISVERLIQVLVRLLTES